MDASFYDNPAILPMLMPGRKAIMGRSRLPYVRDGSIVIKDDISLGYRLFRYEADQPVIVYFHGNGEVATDYDHFAGEFHRAGASLIVIDYRGYGWSTGRPLASAVLPDAEIAADALSGILDEAGLTTSPLFLFGRSLGSAPAIHLARLQPERYRGLMIESGFSHIIPVLMRIGIPVADPANTPDLFGNWDKIKEVHLPTLIIHGENDQLIPVSQGQMLYDASAAENKRLFRVPYAGHNDLLMIAPDDYFAAVRDLMQSALK
jgi:pimeloyl-ACP methyl ester carboxylesterase